MQTTVKMAMTAVVATLTALVRAWCRGVTLPP
jgi:hypothetical protein